MIPHSCVCSSESDTNEKFESLCGSIRTSHLKPVEALLVAVVLVLTLHKKALATITSRHLPILATKVQFIHDGSTV